MRTLKLLVVFLVAVLFSAAYCCAQEDHGQEHNHAGQQAKTVDGDHDDHGSKNHDASAHHEHVALMIFIMMIMITTGRAGMLVEKISCPPVVGELIAGMLLAVALNLIGISPTQDVLSDALIFGAMQIGVNLLLFYTALEENVHNMVKVGPRAFLVAIVGVVLPAVMGFAASKYYYFPTAPLVAHCYMGATLVATSVGITSAVFSSQKYTAPTRTLVIGAAVIDDVLGLVILAVVSAMATGAVVTAAFVGGKLLISLSFLVGAVCIGMTIAPYMGKALSALHPGVGMKQATALLFCFGFGYAAQKLAGLEPIIGAFAGGLVLAPTHFKWFDSPYQVNRITEWMEQLLPSQSSLRAEMAEHKHKKDHAHVETLIERLNQFFVPLYFVGTGMSVDLSVFQNPGTIVIAAVFTLIALAGKLPCGIVAGKGVNKWIVAWSMVARGEVGLVFANLGKASGVLTDQMFAVLVVVVVVTTFLPPPILTRLIKREQSNL